MDSLLRRVIALILVVILTSANLVVLGEYTIAYAASDEELNKQDSKTNNKNVLFNSYFAGEAHIATFDIDSEEAKIYLKLEVDSEGYVENGTIEFENVNFKITDEVDEENIQSIDTDENKIVLNRVSSGSEIVVELPIEILDEDSVSVDNFAKEFTVKFTGTYVDGDGDKKEVTKEITNKLSWIGTAEVELSAEATKFVPYAVDGNYGVMVQTKVNVGIKDGTLPIRHTNLEITVPEFNGIIPSEVKVVATSMAATNGEDEGLDFTSDNYSYNDEERIVTVDVDNLEDSISWEKGVQDEYLVTYLYEGEDIYNYAKVNGINLSSEITANITVYNGEDLSVSQNTNVEIAFTEKEGEIAEFEIEVPSDISKGYIYANYDIDDEDSQIETEYNENYVVTINMADLVTSINFEQGIDTFVTEDDVEGNTTVSGTNYAYNKRVEVRQDIFEKILGEDGSISIKDSSGQEIGVINKDSEVEDDKYILDISDADTNQIVITTTAPLTEGQFEINVVKAIKGDIDYSKNQMKEFETLKATLTGTTDITEEDVEAEIELKEPETKIELEVSNEDWTTVVTNENVEIRAILDVSSAYNALYKDTTLKIILPEEVEEVSVKSINLLLDKGLEVETASLSEENGQKVITVELSGTQTEYAINAAYDGPILVINTDITLDTVAASGEEAITLEYNNGNDVGTNRSGTVEQTVNIVAPTGVVASAGLSDYSDDGEDIVSVSGEDETVTISANSEARTATVEGAVVNNYDYDIKNISILGRIPSEGNTEAGTDTDLGSTFDIPLATTITASGVSSKYYTIYYSENADATQDLDDEENGWSEQATTSSKSYLIDFDDDYVMEKGDKFEFEYDITIPEDVSYNNSAYAMYTVFYDSVSDIGTISETKESAVLGVSTGDGPEAELTLEATTDVIREGQIVEMTVTIENTGTMDIKNAVLVIDAPDGTVHTYLPEGLREYSELEDVERTIEIGDIAVGETVTQRYELLIDEDAATKEIQNMVSLTADNIEGEIDSDVYTFTVEEGDLKITTIQATLESDVLVSGEELELTTSIENISDEDLQNVTLNFEVPDGFTIKDVYYDDTKVFTNASRDGVTIDGQTITVNVGELKSIDAYLEGLGDVDEETSVQLRTITYVRIELEVDSYSGELVTLMTATADGIDTQYSNIRRIQIANVNLTIVQEQPEQQYIKEGTEYSYTFIITNKGDSSISPMQMQMAIPDGLEFVEATYTYEDGTSKTVTTARNGTFTINLLNDLEIDEEIEVEVTVVPEMLTSTEDKKIVTSATLSADGMDDVTSNEVTVYIEYDPTLDHNGMSGSGYKITGVAWFDEDKNGQRDSDEQLLEGITVLLLDKDTSSIVKDEDTNESMQTTTGSDGSYEFTNLPSGDYLVVFVYDSSNFTLTEYQKEGVSSSFNSDAIDVTITLNGEKTIVGMTDTITIDDDNARNIDIGLYTASKFDLRLDKYISKITVTTPSATNTYTYNNSEIAKVEIAGRNLGQSTAVIVFRIVVTNEGSVAGYVNKIVDYLPDEYTFSENSNTGWYQSENGNLYNSSLANEIINPGESKEVTLTLTTTITQDLLGTVTNDAEIYESYNDLGLADIDSTPANQVESEDDMGSADIVFSLNTGKVVTYTAIIFVVIAILGFGIYEIKKRVLTQKY